MSSENINPEEMDNTIQPEKSETEERPEALKIADETFEKYPHIREIAESIPHVYDIIIRPGLFQSKFRAKVGNPDLMLEDPNTKIIYDELGRYLGTTKHQYETVQGKTFLILVLYMIAKCGEDTNLDLSRLTFNEWDDGKLIEFLIPSPPIEFTNRKGVKEVIKQAISARTGYGGNYRHIIGQYEWRMICENGMWGWGPGAQLKLKHTSLNNTKIKQWCDMLHKVLNFQTLRVETYKLMDETDVSSQKTQHFARKLAGIKPTAKLEELHPKTRRVYDDILEGIRIESERCGESVWGLLQGATYYTNHLSRGASRWGTEESIRTKANKDFNDLAQKLCLEMLPKAE